MAEIMNIQEYAQECAAVRAQELQKRIARLKVQASLSGGWSRAIFHAVPYAFRVYDDERMSNMHLDYIEKYLAEPLCATCHLVHTPRTCPACNKSLCIYCEHGTLDRRVNACRECAPVLRREQAQESEV